MWPIAQGVFIHNIHRGHVITMVLVALGLIWTSVDPFVTYEDLSLGDLWTSRLALWSSLVIVLVVVLQELPKEMSSRFHLILLSKPISRFDYVLGKLLGLYAFGMAVLTVLVSLSYLSFFLQCEEDVPLGANFLLPWFHYSMYLWLFCVTTTICGAFLSEAFCLIGIAMVTIGSYVVGILPAMVEGGEVGGLGGLLMSMVYYVVPNFQYFGPSHFQDYGVMAPVYLLIYVIGYSGLVLPLALRQFSRISFH